jgi:hypothetical protein
MTTDDLKKLMAKLNPENEAGRLTLIARFGAGKVGEHLPRLIKAVREEGGECAVGLRPDARQHDQVGLGLQDPALRAVLREVREFFAVHKAEGTIPGGVHFEMTGKDVTECTGGVRAVTDEDLSDRYHTACDPRLNASQSLELAFLVAEELQGPHAPRRGWRRRTRVLRPDGSGCAARTWPRSACRALPSPEARTCDCPQRGSGQAPARPVQARRRATMRRSARAARSRRGWASRGPRAGCPSNPRPDQAPAGAVRPARHPARLRSNSSCPETSGSPLAGLPAVAEDRSLW